MHNHFRNAIAVATVIGLYATGALAIPPAASGQVNTSTETGYGSAGNQPGATATGNDNGYLFTGGIWQQSTLLGDMDGVRPFLGRYGITLNLTETSEILGNTSGGIKRGAYYDGLTTLDLQLDTQRAFGWKGGTFNVSALQIHGENLSARNLDNLQTASGIEADHATRLWEAWYDQSFWYNQADVKIGQQSLDQEFIVSQYALSFVNTMFGWPMLPSADLLSGGPAYPLSSPGIRLRLQPAASPLTLLAGVFDDNPAGVTPGSDQDSQQLNAHGTNFRLSDSPLFIAELQYSYPSLGSMEGSGGEGLPGTYRLGFWYDAGNYADQRYDTAGLSLADPASSGDPRLRRGNYSIYAVVDQMIWRESPESEETAGYFLRVMGAPNDRNLIDFSLNTGLTLKEPFEGRDNDIVGLGFSYAHVSTAAQSLDRQTAFYDGAPYPVRNGELLAELTYQYQIAPWWQVQPDAQYVFNPGGNVLNPDDPNGVRRIGNETVFGIRTNIIF